MRSLCSMTNPPARHGQRQRASYRLRRRLALRCATWRYRRTTTVMSICGSSATSACSYAEARSPSSAMMTTGVLWRACRRSWTSSMPAAPTCAPCRCGTCPSSIRAPLLCATLTLRTAATASFLRGSAIRARWQCDASCGRRIICSVTQTRRARISTLCGCYCPTRRSSRAFAHADALTSSLTARPCSHRGVSTRSS